MHIFSRCFLAFATLSILALDMVYAYAIALNLTGDRCFTGIGPVILPNMINCSLPPRKKCELRMSYCPNDNTTIPTAPEDAVDIATIANLTYDKTYSDVGKVPETTDDFFYILYEAYATDPGAILTGEGYVYYTCNGTSLQYTSTFATLHYEKQNDSAPATKGRIEHWHIANETNATSWNWLALYDQLFLPATPVQQLHRQDGLPDVVFQVNPTNVSPQSVSFDHHTKGTPVAIVRRNATSGLAPTCDVCNDFANRTLKVQFSAEYHLYHESIYQPDGTESDVDITA